MKKSLYAVVGLLVMGCLISWGVTGHRTVALIAANHLTPQAKAAVADLLDGESMASVSNWADEVKNEPKFKHTAGWHFIDLPDNLNIPNFERLIKHSSQSNIYGAFISSLRTIERPNSSKEQKAQALKFIIHLVGDIHQPMHIGSDKNQAGTTKLIQINGKFTDLFTLWENTLLDNHKLSDVQLAKRLDNATLTQLKTWENDNVMTWIWESYQVKKHICEDIRSGANLDNRTVKQQLKTANKQIEKAGIRLAGVLNELFKYDKALSPDIEESALTDEKTTTPIPTTSLGDIGKYVGKKVRLKAKIEGLTMVDNILLMDLGGVYPGQLLTLVLKDKVIPTFKASSNEVEVTGKVIMYRGKPEIVVTDPKNIKFPGGIE